MSSYFTNIKEEVDSSSKWKSSFISSIYPHEKQQEKKIVNKKWDYLRKGNPVKLL